MLVTGGAANIGAAISRAFAAQGARVAVHYVGGPASNSLEHRRPADDQVAAFVETLPGALAFEADFLRPGAAGELFDAVCERFGRIDVLVNNAATGMTDDTFATITQDGLEHTLRVNAVVPALLTAELVRRLPPTWPGRPGAVPEACVINISTDAARGFPGQVGYGASKGALESMTRGAARDLGPRVRVNAVAPGPVQTGWMDDALVAAVTPDIPLGRVGEPADVADAVVFLASHQARWITGQVIQVAGGHWL